MHTRSLTLRYLTPLYQPLVLFRVGLDCGYSTEQKLHSYLWPQSESVSAILTYEDSDLLCLGWSITESKMMSCKDEFLSH